MSKRRRNRKSCPEKEETDEETIAIWDSDEGGLQESDSAVAAANNEDEENEEVESDLSDHGGSSAREFHPVAATIDPDAETEYEQSDHDSNSPPTQPPYKRSRRRNHTRR